MAIIAIVVTQTRAAIVARDAVPVVRFPGRHTAAVGVKYLRNQQKRIKKPALGQGSGNRRTTLAFAEVFVLNMRMGDFIALGGWVRIKGDDAVRLVDRADVVPIEAYLECTQENVVELDRVGGYGQLMGLKVKGECLESLLEGREIAANVSGRS